MDTQDLDELEIKLRATEATSEKREENMSRMEEEMNVLRESNARLREDVSGVRR